MWLLLHLLYNCTYIQGGDSDGLSIPRSDILSLLDKNILAELNLIEGKTSWQVGPVNGTDWLFSLFGNHHSILLKVYYWWRTWWWLITTLSPSPLQTLSPLNYWIFRNTSFIESKGGYWEHYQCLRAFRSLHRCFKGCFSWTHWNLEKFEGQGEYFPPILLYLCEVDFNSEASPCGVLPRVLSWFVLSALSFSLLPAHFSWFATFHYLI